MPATDIIAKPHLKYLDSARGIASMMVFGCHFLSRNFQEKMNMHYFFLVFNGQEAVNFFFVLSGFVLSYKYIVRNKSMDIVPFYVSRLFRLFPGFFLMVLAGALFQHRNELGLHFLKDLFVYNKYEFWEEALLLRFHNKFYGPGWTLTFEMAGSFLMPFYIALALKDRRLISYFIAVTIIIGSNLMCSYYFLFGVLASGYHAKIAGTSFRQTKWFKWRYPLLIVAAIFFEIRHIDGISPFGPSYKYLAGYLNLDFSVYAGIGCFIFLVAILHSKRIQRVLENRILVFYGKISFSIYLVHVLVMDSLYLYLGNFLSGPNFRLRFILVALTCTLLVTIAATLLHYSIELPFMRMGKRVVSRMKPSLIIGRNID